ncbi:hypothetical protein KGF56_000280 [Candida oxycetoniae]|uniref:Uncharacterized protein n=1 Tax=Candida oxycetoniae TaxID=497107 RepID=A0AAI9T1P6_9ASCO|nr:uncharacterized protein KGF56_000280 [Candida oxycetoniae]KAI3406987.2 hypothetical protein KGF56_000280 [Candida oxycetoniae]
MSANLQTKLDNSLNDILKTAGFVFEIINNNKNQSRLITGPNNQLIQPTIIQQLTSHIDKFGEILDETIFKFNDAKWCIDTMIGNKQRQEEIKIKEELERQKREAEAKRLREEAEAKLKAEAEAAEKARLEAEAEARAKAKAKAEAEAEAEAKAQAERELAELERLRQEEEKKRIEEEEAEEKRKQSLQQQQQQQQQQQEQHQQQQRDQFNDFNDFLGFDMDEIQRENGGDRNDPLSSMNYNDLNLDVSMDDAEKIDDNNIFDVIDIENAGEDFPQQNNNIVTKNANDKQVNDLNQNNNGQLGTENVEEMDLDMNNLLGNDESILDGLNMSLLDTGFEGEDAQNNINNNQMGDEFDVDNFLNQFSS